MQRLAIALLLVALTSLGGNTLAAPSPERDELGALLQSRYAAMKAAMAARDAGAISALLTADFESLDADGKSQSAAQMIAGVLALAPDPSRSSETTIVSIREANGVATVSQRYRMTKSLVRPGETSARSILLVAVSTDTWQQVDGSWRLRRSVTESIDYSVDGRLSMHKVRVDAPKE
jgi:hypothetical protein